MSQWIGVAVMVMAFAVSALADYVTDRKAAVELMRAGKNEEALAAFTKMAAGAASDVQKSDALQQAALCADDLKQYDRAIKLAQEIPLTPNSKSVQMRIMLENRKFPELVAKFKDEDTDPWPADVSGEALFYRGRAYYHLKDGKAAEADMAKAADRLPDGEVKWQALLFMGNNYLNNLKDDKKALDAYAQVIRKFENGNWIYLQAVISSTGILRTQGKYDEALQMLAKIDPKELAGNYWPPALRYAYGETYSAQGKKAEAIAKFKEALAVAGNGEWKEPCQDRIKELEAAK